MSEHVRLIGFDDLEKKLRAGVGVPEAAGAFLDKWRFSVERGAKANIKRGPGGWLWHGGDRRSLTSERDHSAFPLWAWAGSNSPKIRAGEYGTNRRSEDPTGETRRYPFPSARELGPWAKAHGLSAYAVAISIRRKHGLEPRRFLRDAAAATEKKVPSFLAAFARDIERQAAR